MLWPPDANLFTGKTEGEEKRVTEEGEGWMTTVPQWT